MSFKPSTYTVTLLSLILAQRCLAKCPTGFKEQGTNGTKCSSLGMPSLVHGQIMDFQKALAYCNSLKATLPEPRSQTEFDLLKQGVDFWLGIKDLGLVPNQRIFSYISDNVTVSYNGWRISEEPRSHREQAVCTILRDGRWEARGCDEKHDVVCETIFCPGRHRRKGKKCYKIVRKTKTYAQATQSCKEKHGFLAEPGTREEKANIIELIQKESQKPRDNNISQYLWLGAKYTKDCRWVWQHSGDTVNSSMIYSIPCTGEEDCLAMDKTGDWEDRGCSNKISSVCESGIDGGVSLWKAWSECSVSDGVCLRHRERECNKPVPRYGGRQCKELLTESKVCGTRYCEEINCQSLPNPCGHGHHRCVPLIEKRYTCECGKGYQLENKTHPTCIEVNKCESTKDICRSEDGTEHKCVYTPGSKKSYRCDCQEGYENVDNIFCDPIIDRPKPPTESLSLPDYPVVKVAAATLSFKIILFFTWIIVMDVKLFLGVIYRFCTTEPVPEPETDSDDEEDIIAGFSKPHSEQHWQSGDFVLERGEYIWAARVRGVQNASVEISPDNSLDDSSSSLLINSTNSLDSAMQSNLTLASSTDSTQLADSDLNQS